MTFDRGRTSVEKSFLESTIQGLEPSSRLCFLRDEKKRVIQSFACDKEGHPTDETVTRYIYNAQGLLAEEQELRAGSIVERNVYEYDSNGRQVAWRVYDKNGLRTTVLLKYEHDKSTVHIEHSSGGLTRKELHKVDEQGRPVDIVTFDQNGEVLTRQRLRYDGHGKWIERTSSGRGGESREVRTYEYDERGNWVKRTTLLHRDGIEEKKVTRRVIEYFPE